MTRALISTTSTAVMGTALLVAAALLPMPASAKPATLKQACPAAASWHKAQKERSQTERQPLDAIKPSNPALAKVLSQRTAEDQAVRKALVRAGQAAMDNMKSAAWEKVQSVDAKNLAWLKPEIEAHGFPTVAEVGLKGVENAWLLIQHADRDPSLQTHVLAEIKPRLAHEPFLRADYALLDDRLMVDRGEKQIYGTQFQAASGQAYLSPTEDMAGLAKRRAEMDLPPMSDYMCILRHEYHAPVHLGAPPKATKAKT